MRNPAAGKSLGGSAMTFAMPPVLAAILQTLRHGMTGKIATQTAIRLFPSCLISPRRLLDQDRKALAECGLLAFGSAGRKAWATA